MNVPGAYREEVSSQLMKLDQNIEKLSAKADQAADRVKQEYAIQVAMLRARQQAVHDQLQGLIEMGDRATDDLKTSLDRAVHDLEQVVAAANNRLN